MGVLDQLGLKYNADKSSRFHNYLDFYEKVLPDRSFKGRLLEIGVMDGCSQMMWREYYPEAEIIGIDIYDKEHLYNSDWGMPESVKLLKLDGTDPKQMEPLGKFDIIIDDGSHMTKEQQKSFDILYYKQLNENGIYIIEDLWTSMMREYINSRLTTIEWLKRLEKAGMKVEYFFHKHKGIEKIFPEYKGLDSQTVAIKAGQ